MKTSATTKAQQARRLFLTYRLIAPVLLVVTAALGVPDLYQHFHPSNQLIIAAALVLLALCFFVYKTVPVAMKFFCPCCGKFIKSTIPWVCGVCSEENHRTGLSSFLGACEHCKERPRAFQCSWCSGVIYFG